MPYANNNIVGEPWRTCDRCGFIHPIGMLRKQLGLLLCDCHRCTDDLSNERRRLTISKLLPGAKQNEAVNPIIERLKDKGEVIFEGNDT